MAELFTLSARATDSNGDNLSGAKLYFYATGTTTPQNVFADSDLNTSLGAVVTADSGGKFVAIYLDPALTYRAVLKTSDGATTVYDFDPIGNGILTELASTTQGSDGASLIGAYDPTAPAYLKTVSDIISGLPVNLFRFIPSAKHAGIRSRSNADDLSTNFADALASGAKEINVEPGLYNTTTAIPMTTVDQALRGAGSRRTEIRITSTTASAVTLANGIAGYGLIGFKITRVGVPGAAAHGVQCLGTTDDSTFEDLWIDGHYHNLILNTCDTGFIHKMRLSRALGYGCYQTNAAAYGPSQWDVFNVLFDRNTVDGWRIESTAGPAGMILGTMSNVRGFANGGRDLHVIGSNTTPVYDLRVSDAFFGSSNGGCVRLNTYGGKHRINGFFERAGRDACGPTLAIAASQTATCIEMTANNVDLVVYGSTIDEASYDGILHDGGLLNVSGCMIYNNGAATAVGRRNGILSQGGRLTVGSDTIVNAATISGGAIATSQLYAVATSHSNVVIGASDLRDNVTASMTLGATTNAVVAANATDSGTLYRFPNTIDVLKFNSAYTPTATGGDKGAGTINVATDAYKNNTAYTNP